MKVVPLGAESLGVRSMATYVEAAGRGVLIDPGATLAPSRFGLPPADEEWEALRRVNDRISAYAARAELVFVSHYREDHFRSDPASYAGRRVLVKDPHRMVEGLQARRAAEFWNALQGHARVAVADDLIERWMDVMLEVSPPLPQGLGTTTLGYVVALTIVEPGERERFVFASDVQGPLSPVAAEYLVRQRPTLLYLAGPPSYVEREVGADVIERGIDHLMRIVETTGCRVIMDHHALRDVRWRERFARLWDTGRVTTAAGYLGIADATLESRRGELWSRSRTPRRRRQEFRYAGDDPVPPNGDLVLVGKLGDERVLVVISSHALRRMQQRDIDESEILEALAAPRSAHTRGKTPGHHEIAWPTEGGRIRVVYARPGRGRVHVITAHREQA